MKYILCIESATHVCSIALYKENEIIAGQQYHLDKSHASLLPEIIRELFDNCQISLKELDAIGVSDGPGSYTGLRIGNATAKGLAYSLQIPIIAVPTLDILTEQVRRDPNGLYCPMIDARRMEVYCYLSDYNGKKLWETTPLIVEPDTFDRFDQNIYLFGNGSEKCKEVFKSRTNIKFIDRIYPRADEMGHLTWIKFQENQFEDLAYYEPNYLKEFRTKAPKNRLVG